MSVSHPTGRDALFRGVKSGTFKINSLWQLECAKGRELPGQHIRQDLGLVFNFFLFYKKKKEKEPWTQKSWKFFVITVSRHYWTSFIHMCSIFSLKISFGLSEGSNSELLRSTISWAGTVSQTFAKTSQLIELYPRLFILIHNLLCSTETRKIWLSHFSLVFLVLRRQNLLVIQFF